MDKPITGMDNSLRDPNRLWTMMQLEDYFVPITDSERILKSLYVTNTLSRRDPFAGEQIPLNDGYPKVLLTPGVHSPHGSTVLPLPRARNDVDCQQLARFITNALRLRKPHRRVRNQRSSTRLLVLLGGIGEGKSTLLDYFFRVYAPRKEQTSSLVRLNVDFEENADVTKNTLKPALLANLLLDSLKEQFDGILQDPDAVMRILDDPMSHHRGFLALIERLQGKEARAGEEARLVARLYRNPLTLLAGAINYLANVRRCQVVVTLDNVDRLEKGCQTIAMTLIRQALRQWDCCAIVCVREYTYGRLWVMTEWGYESPLLYHKRPPRFASVLKGRFEKFPVNPDQSEPLFMLGDIPVYLHHRSDFLVRTVKFLWEKNMERSLRNLCNGNVRQMLTMVKAFLSSSDLDLEHILRASYFRDPEEAMTQRLTANFDNFMRAITVGNFTYYSSAHPEGGGPESYERA